ncbi:tetratricopeptide repeat protein [Candidatus Parcubacteria bacterium]|nr:tetratricopeptide repeat protein [Patescibacteria group bacterium]MCG2689398.1 tetratricopeptide repeat protein [Candidatus Parcubacteria bacterium]
MINIKESLKINKYLIFIFVVAVFATYCNSLGNSFVSDDIPIILGNPNLANFSYIFNNLATIISSLTYFIIVSLFGKNPTFFRLFNILFHAGNVILIYFLVKKLHNKKIAVLTSLIFATHPILSESVAWISGGPYPRYSFFFLLSFLLYIYKNKHNNFYTFSIISFFLSLQSNDKAVPLLAIFVLYEMLFGKLKENWKKVIPYFLMSVLYLLYFTVFSGLFTARVTDLNLGAGQEPGRDNPLIQIPTAITEYLKLIFWPQGLTLYHSELSLSSNQFALRVIAFLVFCALGIWGFIRNRKVFFWLSWFVISLAVTLTPFRISWIVAERYVYLGSIGVIVIFSMFVNWVLGRYKLQGLYWSLLILIVFPLSIRTIIRNADWKSHDTLWLATAKYSPNSPQNHNNLGDYYGRMGDQETAIIEFKKAIELKPNYADAYHNLANTYQQLERFDEAVENYQKAIEFNPGLWQSYQNLGVIYYHQKNFDEALKYFKESLKINPNNDNLQKLVDVIR